MNLQAITAAAVGAVNPPLTGTVRRSTGYAMTGDATFVGSISGVDLTVTSISGGAIVPGVSALATGAIGNVLSQISGTTGGVGVYALDTAGDVSSSLLTTVGDGTPAPAYTDVTGVIMQIQPLSGDELDHIDSLNITGIKRAIYLQGNVQGTVRAAAAGGDLILVNTGMTSAEQDTWLVVDALETWDTDGWCRVAVVLQNPPQDQ